MSVLSAFINSIPGAVAQGLSWGLMAIGVYITYRVLDVADLTVDGSIATGGAVCAVAITLGVNPWIALLLAVIAGMLAGFVTGILHTACGIPAILAGILTQLALYSLNLRIMAIGSDDSTKATLALSVDKQDLLLSSRFVRELGLNNPIILLLAAVAVIVALLYLFFGTEIGSALRATGCNPNMARAQGINTDRSKILALVVSNGMVALAGALISQYQGSAAVDMGRGAIVIGLAAVIIGEVLLSRVRNFALKLLSCVLGAIIYYLVITLVLRLGLESTDLKLLTAVVVAAFLSVPYWKNRYFTKTGKAGAGHA
jgi:putative ABC transport system permease protein